MTLPPLATRATEFTPDERRIIAKFLREMRQTRPGEILKLYVPKHDALERSAQRRRIVRALKAGEAPASIAKREGVSEGHVRKMRGRIGAPIPP